MRRWRGRRRRGPSCSRWVGRALPWSFEWDSSDNPTATTLPTSFSSPTTGQATAEYLDTANPHFPTTVRDYATAATDPATWAYTYDPNGYLIEATNADEAVTYRYCYDGLGQLQRIDAPPVTVPLDFDTTTGCGTANQGNDTLFGYDTAGNLTSIDPPGPHGTQTFTYDDVSRVATMTDGRGVVTTFTYDALDHVTKLAYTQPVGGSLPGTPSINYTYDTAGNLLEVDPTNGGDTLYTYDDLNRTSRIETDRDPAWDTTYTYDTAGNLTALDASDAPVVTYAYDNVNRVTSVVDQKGRTTSFGYDTRDNRTSTAYPGGVTERQVFDDSNRLTCIYAHTGTKPTVGADGCPSPSSTLVTFYSYSYTGPGGRDTTTRNAETNRDGDTTAYGYDDLTRLKTATTTASTGGTPLRSYTYAMGPRGNITKETVTGTTVANTTTSFGYNDAGELCWTVSGTTTADCSTTPAGATTYSYDDAGNQTGTSAGQAIGYTLAGQAAQVTPPGGDSLAMTYFDASSDQRRTAGTTQFSYTALGLAAQGPTGTNDHASWFLRDPAGKLLAMIDRDPAATDRYYLSDGLGSVRATTNQTGGIVKRYLYEPYGEQLNLDLSDTNPWRYAAGYYDTTTGMLKYGTRYYQPNIMRWTQPDPVAGNPANPMSLNPYNYVGCNPINATDPLGRTAEGDIAREVGTIIGGTIFGIGGGVIGGFGSPLGALIGLLAGECVGGYFGYAVGDLMAGDKEGTFRGAVGACVQNVTLKTYGKLLRRGAST